MEWLSGKPIIVVADREFASPRLAEWLKNAYDVEVTLRIKVGLFLSGLRAISTKLKHANVKQFRNFIRILLQPFFKAWEIPAII